MVNPFDGLLGIQLEEDAHMAEDTHDQSKVNLLVRPDFCDKDQTNPAFDFSHGFKHAPHKYDPSTEVEAGDAKISISTTGDNHGIGVEDGPKATIDVSPANQDYDPQKPSSDWVPHFQPIFEVGGDAPDPGHPDPILQDDPPWQGGHDNSDSNESE